MEFKPPPGHVIIAAIPRGIPLTEELIESARQAARAKQAPLSQEEVLALLPTASQELN